MIYLYLFFQVICPKVAQLEVSLRSDQSLRYPELVSFDSTLPG